MREELKTPLSRGLAASKTFGDDVARRLLDGARTAGQKVRQATLIDRLHGSKIRSLSPEDQRTVGAVLADGGEPVARAMADGGPGPFVRLHRIGDDIDGVNPEALASGAGRAMDDGVAYSRVERFVDDLDALQRADVDGVGRLAGRVVGSDASNFKGAAFEARVAVARGTDTVNELGKPNPYARGEIDIETTDGTVIETKSGDLSNITSDDVINNRILDQVSRYQEYVVQEGGSVEVVFRTEPSDAVRSALENRGIDLSVI